MSDQEKKRKKPVMVTGRSRKFLEEQGYIVALVERTVNVPRKDEESKPGFKKRFINKFDAFGFADLIAVRAGDVGTLYIQTTTASHQAERRTKILDLGVTKLILQSQNRIVVHGWKKKQQRGVERWIVIVSECKLVDGKPTFVDAGGSSPDDKGPNLFDEEDDF